MRKHKIIKLDEKEITVKELRVKDIIEILESADGNAAAGIKELLIGHLPKVVDLKLEDIIEMAPSELQTIWDAAKEVNAAFFDVARAMGAEKILSELKASLEKSFSGIVADSLKLAI
ncbi:MAG: hypothetical protein RBT11_19090 [Desulfobacterales bacterium]|jgi:hypothetical protein|nr:hypothetical protein [Desulfobacterales bacterium]